MYKDRNDQPLLSNIEINISRSVKRALHRKKHNCLKEIQISLVNTGFSLGYDISQKMYMFIMFIKVANQQFKRYLLRDISKLLESANSRSFSVGRSVDH